MADSTDVKIERVKEVSEGIRAILGHRYGVLPTVATLAATLLIVATFNENVIPLTDFVRLLISLLLLSIPVAIWGLLLQTRNDLEKMTQTLGKIVEVKETRKKTTWEQVLQHLPEVVSALVTIVILATICLIWSGRGYRSPRDCNVAYIKLDGQLVTYPLPGSSVQTDVITSSDNVTAAIRNAEHDWNKQAIILEVDSNGGSGVAGEEIQAALKASQKPTVALIRDSGVSAAYMAATGANVIYASQFSYVGSVGVTESYVDNSQQNASNGLTFNQLSIGKYKDMMNPDKPLTADEQVLAMQQLQMNYKSFVQMVSANRHMSIDQITKLADGSSFTGQQALQNGLIDKIGNIEDVRQYLEKKLSGNATICGIDTSL